MVTNGQHAEECMQCGWSFDQGGTEPDTFTPAYGILQGQSVTFCQYCRMTSSASSGQINTLDAAIGKAVNLLIRELRDKPKPVKIPGERISVCPACLRTMYGLKCDGCGFLLAGDD